MPEDKSIYDLIIDEMLDRQRWAKEELANRFKKTRPFRTEPISSRDLLKVYNSIKTPEQLQEYIDINGQDKVNDFLRRVETMKQGGQGNA